MAGTSPAMTPEKWIKLRDAPGSTEVRRHFLAGR